MILDQDEYLFLKFMPGWEGIHSIAVIPWQWKLESGSPSTLKILGIKVSSSTFVWYL